MAIGISSSCFYPLETEKSLVRVGETGAKITEVFFNSPSELEKGFLNELNEIKNSYGMEIKALHPFMSFAEGFYIFSGYKRRFHDSLEMYSKFFEAAAQIGAKLFVLHGAKVLEIDKEEYAERLFLLGERAKSFDVSVAHENVVDYVGQDPGFMAYLKSQLGSDFKMVLDIKQARRTKVDPYEFIERTGESIVHVHLSDFKGALDCLPPGEGEFDFSKLFRALSDRERSYIIELYSRNFESDSQLVKAMEFLKGEALKKLIHNS